MSRHIIRHPQYEIVVGWDAALDTYFATVIAPSQSEDEPVIWLGTVPAEYPELRAFLDVLAGQLQSAGILDVDLSSTLVEQLLADSEQEGKEFSKKSSDIKRFLMRSKS